MSAWPKRKGLAIDFKVFFGWPDVSA